MKTTEKSRVGRMRARPGGLFAAALGLALAFAWAPDGRGELAPVTVARWERQTGGALQDAVVPVPDATLQDGKLFVDLQGIGGVKPREIERLGIRFFRGGQVASQGGLSAEQYLELVDGACVFHLGTWVAEPKNTGLLGNADALELTGFFDPFASPPPMVGGGERVVANPLPWAVEFRLPEGMALKPGEHATFGGDVIPADANAFLVDFDWKLGQWQVRLVSKSAWPVARMVWKEAPGDGIPVEEPLPEEAILAFENWDSDTWAQGVLTRQFGLDPTEYEKWKLEWGQTLAAEIGGRTVCNVTWHLKPEPAAHVRNTGKHPLRWGTNAIPAGGSVTIPWTDAEALREVELAVEPLPEGKTQHAFTFGQKWPDQPVLVRGALNTVKIRAVPKPPPAVLIFNNEDVAVKLVDARHETGIIQPGKSWCYAREDLREGDEVALDFMLLRDGEHQAWPEKVTVPVVMPDLGMTNEAQVAFPPVTLLVTNPAASRAVVVGVDGFTLAPGESETQEIPWAEARGRSFDVEWKPVQEDKRHWLPGSQTVHFEAPGTTQAVECSLERRAVDVPVTNTGRVGLLVQSPGGEAEGPVTIEPGETRDCKVFLPEAGDTEPVTFELKSENAIWHGGTVLWTGEGGLEVEAMLDEDALARTVANVARGASELDSELAKKHNPCIDRVAFIQNGMARLHSCGLTEAELPAGAGPLPDWFKLWPNVSQWRAIENANLDGLWDIMEAHRESWDAFMEYESGK